MEKKREVKRKIEDFTHKKAHPNEMRSDDRVRIVSHPIYGAIFQPRKPP